MSDVDIENPDSLRSYLSASERVPADEAVEIKILQGGVSNKTVRVGRADGTAWVLKQALPRLRVQVDWFSPVERIHHEARGLRWLAELTPAGSVPGFMFEDHEQHILAMEAVPDPHDNWKTLLLAGRLSLDHVDQFARLLAMMHSKSAARREELAPLFDDRSFFESLRLDPYYGYAALQVPAAADFLTNLISRTRARRLTLVHGDYSPKNVLVHKGRLVLLDHEVIHFGDPAFDLGFGLCHLLSKAHFLRDQRTAFAEAARRFWSVYAADVVGEPWTVDLEEAAVHHTMGCLLARAAGKSPLEYLDGSARERQRDAIVSLVESPSGSVPDLVNAFLLRVDG